MKTQSIFYLENNHGEAVRALPVNLKDSEHIHFIFREDTKRVEVVSDLSALDRKSTPYKKLESIKTSLLSQKHRIKLNFSNFELTLVEEIQNVQNDGELPHENEEKFVAVLKKISSAAAILVLLLFGMSFFIKNEQKIEDEPHLVQVIDREKISTPIVKMSEVPVEKSNLQSRTLKPIQQKKIVVKKTLKNQFARKKSQTVQLNQMGALAVLGNVKTSSQKGGLRLDQAQVSRGAGRGGTQGSGGVQTAIYAKGLFAAPVGVGQRADGAGGYGTKGKGGGQGGYGEIKMAGAAGSFFEPIENEVWTEGGLDRNEIAAVIQRHLSEVRFCYEKGLQKNPKLSGRVSMKFLIGSSGQVTMAQVGHSSLNHIPSESCIRDRLKTWKFPEPQGGVTVKVSYPFVLRRVTDS